MANEITTYKGNNKTISVSVPAGYSGYTVNFTVCENEYDEDTMVFNVTGVTVTNNVAVVNITKEQNDIEEKVYWYQVDIVQDPYKFTVAKSTYSVIPSIT